MVNMIKNYLLLTFRNLYRKKIFSIVSIVSLSLGMAVALLILNYVVFESSYDNWHNDKERIYRVESQFYEASVLTDDWATSSYGYGTAMKQELAEVEMITRFDINNPEQIVSFEDKKYRENSITSVDSTFFDMFNFDLAKGDKYRALNAPNKVVITPYVASKYFQGIDPIGKRLKFNSLNGEIICEVSGVLSEMPKNSQIQFDFFISWKTLPDFLDNYWYRHEVYTYVKLKPNADPKSVEAAFPIMAEKYKTEDALKNKTWAVVLNPLEDVHLTPWKQYEREAKGNSNSISTLILVAFAILVIAWINYINMTTARSMERAREVGIRKVSGGIRSQLVTQFMMESTVMNLISFILAVFITWMSAPLLNQLVGKEINFLMLQDPTFWLSVTVVFVVGIILSGFYPAFIISNVKPNEILKGKYTHSGSASIVRKCLVVLQFIASLVLITGTFTVNRQIDFMQNQPLGVNIDNVIAIKYPASSEGFVEKLQAFKSEMKSVNGVSGVTLSNSVPVMEVAYFLSNMRTNDAARQNRLYEMLVADYDYMDTYDLALVAGRGFGEGFFGDENSVVLNEASVGALGFASPQEAIGQKVSVETRENSPMEIVGVVKNYHQQGLNNTYTPIMFIRETAITWLPLKYISIKCDNANLETVLAKAENLWNELFHESTFDNFFVDKFYQSQYQADQRFGAIFAIFSGLALLISVVGLWVLTLFAAMNRRKEMGVRKVFGATGGNLFYSLSKEFMVLLGISILCGVPLAWFTMDYWLTTYAFRIDIVWWMVVVPILVITFVTLATISGQIIATLLANPIRSLKSE